MNVILEDLSENDKRNQGELLNQLFEEECKFRDKLSRSKAGRKVFEDFIHFIVEEEKNLLTCRVFFRERQKVFSSKVVKAIESNNVLAVSKFKINYKFCTWAMSRAPESLQKQLQPTLNKIIDLRKKVCEQSLPSAIHKAKVFWATVNYSQLSYMDMIQLASEGLMIAIDKYELPYAANFGNVVYGRMTLAVADAHNDTLLKFSIKERRILQRAKRAMQKDVPSIESFVKESFADTNATEITDIVNAESSLALDTPLEGGGQIGDFITDGVTPEQKATETNLHVSLYKKLSILNKIELKIVHLKYGELLIALVR